MKPSHWVLLAALAASTAAAQAPVRPDPADPRARAPAPTYRSVFEGYRRIESGPRTSWREANDETVRIGGHIGILREQAARAKQAAGERK